MARLGISDRSASDHFQTSSAGHFQKMISKGKKSRSTNSWMVDVHSKYSEKYTSGPNKGKKKGNGYAQMNCYLSRDGQMGFAITKSGDLVSVFSRDGKRGALNRIIPTAIALGAKKLDCYGGGLQNMYARYGAKATGKTNFVRAYAPDDWTGKKKDRHKIVAMTLPKSLRSMERAYNPNAQINMGKVRQFNSYDKMIADRNLRLSLRDKQGGVRGALGSKG